MSRCGKYSSAAAVNASSKRSSCSTRARSVGSAVVPLPTAGSYLIQFIYQTNGPVTRLVFDGNYWNNIWGLVFGD